MRLLLSIVLLFLTSSLFSQKILFVGNSLTYSNDLPQIVETIGKFYGKKIRTECLCLPNYGLEDHWNDGLVQKQMQNKGYDYVIFQQGPSSQAYGRSSLFDFGGKISTLAKANDIKPAYFMVWPSIQYYHTFDGVIKNHSDAAKENDALLIEVGSVWKSYRNSENLTNLYTQDQFHPSKAGSFLAALIHIKTLFPEIDLESLRHKKFKAWVKDASSFKKMTDLVSFL